MRNERQNGANKSLDPPAEAAAGQHERLPLQDPLQFELSRSEVCFHCGNRVPLARIAVHNGQELFEHIDGQRYGEEFEYHIYQCPTCLGATIYGNFT